jgi:hypothetical protein
MQTPNIEQMAQKIRAHFTAGTRGAPGIGKIDILRDDAPEWLAEWLRDTIHNNASTLPCDWRYRFVVDSLDHLADVGDPDDRPDLDSLYPATRDRRAWHADAAESDDDCRAAASEYGYPKGGADDLISLGMAYRLDMVYSITAEMVQAAVSDAESAALRGEE